MADVTDQNRRNSNNLIVGKYDRPPLSESPTNLVWALASANGSEAFSNFEGSSCRSRRPRRRLSDGGILIIMKHRSSAQSLLQLLGTTNKAGSFLMHKLPVVLFLAVSAFVYSAISPANEEFPFRARYQSVPIMTTAELGKRFGEVLVIDVRSKYEFETLHIKDAVHAPLTTTFDNKIAQLRAKHKKPFVFYCNGKTCLKSYDAVLSAAKANHSDLYAYDAGIFDWAKAQPTKTVLLGRSPIPPGTLIDEGAFTARLIAPNDFALRVGHQSIVLDVRDRIQRDVLLFPFREQRAPLDDLKKIDAVINDAKAQKKTLLVYDQAGKQVQWLQYYLENRGVKDYYFMKGGAQAYSDAGVAIEKLVTALPGN